MQIIDQNERIAILGASRGLGLELLKKILEKTRANLWVSSRKIGILNDNEYLREFQDRIESISLDYSKPSDVDKLIECLLLYKPTRLFYCAGGGPFGLYSDKPWHSHTWAFNLNLLVPAQLLHTILKNKENHFETLKQVIFIGSSIAENAPDPGASSYASAKHGLNGLIKSIVMETQATPIDLRLYSPGYMDTGLLPPNSRPRLDGSLIADPEKIAEDLLDWAHTPIDKLQWHRVSNGNEFMK